jgi:hypothetical protein
MIVIELKTSALYTVAFNMLEQESKEANKNEISLLFSR